MGTARFRLNPRANVLAMTDIAHTGLPAAFATRCVFSSKL